VLIWIALAIYSAESPWVSRRAIAAAAEPT